jgi:DNA-binding NtrC family response regulator
VEVEDLGSTNGVKVAGRRLASGARVELRPGDSVQVGPFVGLLVEASSPAAGASAPRAAIRIADPTPDGVPDVVSRIATSTVSVHISGETGAGKEVLARTIHDLSGRKGTFVAVNCATLSENLLESELFGHERGAFTGAQAAKPGLLEVAAGGTVLLDEIGDLPAALQGKLLRVLETRQVYRVGGVKPITLDARFLSATHRDLVEEVAEGRFRADLYFRVNGITLVIAPLRARRAAIAGLAQQLLAAAAGGKRPPRFTAEAIAALTRHDWPGNVRELRTVVERALLMAVGDEIGAGDLLFDRVVGTRSDDQREAAPVDEAERARLAALAAEHGGNVTTMAQTLKTSRTQVRRLIQRHGIDLDQYRK